jgi:hypothetical protein
VRLHTDRALKCRAASHRHRHRHRLSAGIGGIRHPAGAVAVPIHKMTMNQMHSYKFIHNRKPDGDYSMYVKSVRFTRTLVPTFFNPTHKY